MSEPILKIDGEVEHPREMTVEDFAAIEAAFQIPDVSQIDPKRKGVAVTLESVLALVAAKPTAKFLTLHASTDDFHASVPLEAVRERAILIYQFNGEPLPLAAGGPVRFYIRDFAACQADDVDECANVKFLDRIELSVDRGFDNRPTDETSHEELHRRQEGAAPE